MAGIKVGVYDEPQVQSAPLPGVQPRQHLTSEDLVGNVPEGLMSLGKEGLGYARQAKREADITASTKAENEYQAFLARESDGDSQNPDPSGRVGILTEQGEAAYVAADGYRKRWDEQRRKLNEGLANDEQRRRFGLRSQRLMDAHAGLVEKHLGQQGILVRDATSKATQQLGADAISNHAFDDNYVAEQIGRVASDIEEKARLQGFGPSHPITKAAVADWESRAVATRLEKLLASGDPGAHRKAEVVFAAAQGQKLLGDKAKDFEGRLTQNAFDVAGGMKAVGWVREHTNKAGRPDTDVVLKRLSDLEADKDVDPRLKKATREAVEHQLRLATAGWAAKEDRVFNRAYTKVVANGYNLAAAKNERDYLLSAGVDGGKAWDALEERVRRHAKEDAEGLPPTAEQKSNYTAFLWEITDPDKKGEYGRMTSADFERKWGGAKLSKQDFHAAQGHGAALRSQLAKPDETLPKSVEEELVNHARSAFGMKKGSSPKTWRPEKQEAFYQAQRDLLAAQAEAKRNGKELDPEVVKRKFDYWLTPGRVEGTGVLGSSVWEDSTTRAELVTNPEFAGKQMRDEIPATMLKEIKAELEAADTMPDPEAIKWMYQRRLGLNPPRPEIRVGLKQHRAKDAAESARRVGTLSH